jgi:hypothetical protein
MENPARRNNVARFHFEYMDVPQTIPGFIPRNVEDDELPFDPKTLAPKVSAPVEPAIDLEAESQSSPEQPTTMPPAETAADDAKGNKDAVEQDEPTQDEISASRHDPDSPEDNQEEDVPIAAPEPMRV